MSGGLDAAGRPAERAERVHDRRQVYQLLHEGAGDGPDDPGHGDEHRADAQTDANPDRGEGNPQGVSADRHGVDDLGARVYEDDDVGSLAGRFRFAGGVLF